jgi:hypothetical protein
MRENTTAIYFQLLSQGSLEGIKKLCNNYTRLSGTLENSETMLSRILKLFNVYSIFLFYHIFHNCFHSLPFWKSFFSVSSTATNEQLPRQLQIQSPFAHIKTGVARASPIYSTIVVHCDEVRVFVFLIICLCTPKYRLFQTQILHKLYWINHLAESQN